MHAPLSSLPTQTFLGISLNLHLTITKFSIDLEKRPLTHTAKFSVHRGQLQLISKPVIPSP